MIGHGVPIGTDWDPGRSPIFSIKSAVIDRLRPGSHLDADPQSELQHPAPDGFVEGVEPSFGEEILDVSVAEREAQVNPDGMLDDNRRKSVTSI